MTRLGNGCSVYSHDQQKSHHCLPAEHVTIAHTWRWAEAARRAGARAQVECGNQPSIDECAKNSAENLHSHHSDIVKVSQDAQRCGLQPHHVFFIVVLLVSEVAVKELRRCGEYFLQLPYLGNHVQQALPPPHMASADKCKGHCWVDVRTRDVRERVNCAVLGKTTQSSKNHGSQCQASARRLGA